MQHNFSARPGSASDSAETRQRCRIAHPLAILFACLGLFAIPAASAAECDVWRPMGAGLPEQVNALVEYNGQLIAGGAFVTGIARWDGAAWQTLGPGLSGTVHALLQHGSDLIVAGEFTVGGSQNIARWDGSSWHPMGDGMGGPVFALTIHDHQLIAGGWFTTAGGQPANRVARWDGSTWHPLGTGIGGPNPFVFALASHGQSLFAAGSFQFSTGEGMAQSIARWDGAQWHPVGTIGTIVSLAVFQDELVAGLSVGGSWIHQVVRWDGSTWHPLGTGIDREVRALTIYDNQLVAGGRFTRAGAHHQIAYGIARWDGGSWLPLHSGIGDVYSLAVFGDDLIAGGSFSHTFAGDNIAAWRTCPSTPCGRWRPLGEGLGTASAMVEYNNSIYVAHTSPDSWAHELSRWDGATWQPQDIDVGVATIGALAVHNADLIAGGSFMQIGGVQAQRIARWDGAAWHPLGGGIGGSAGAIVHALATLPNGNLVAAGDFEFAIGGSQNIAMWNGVSWQSLGSGTNGPVRALTIYNNQLVAGGAFTVAGGVSALRIARWNGSSWEAMGQGFTYDGFEPETTVLALIVHNGNLLAGGTKLRTDLGLIARWTGSDWEEFAPTDLWGSVTSITTDGDAVIAAGSTHSAIVGLVARWDGTAWHPLGDGLWGLFHGYGPPATALVFNHELYVAGGFSAAGGGGAAGIAVWRDCIDIPCYANCTGSTEPRLDISDFTCFIDKFTEALSLPHEQQVTHYANCDGSTTPPVLNIHDLVCFINSYAAGCP